MSIALEQSFTVPEQITLFQIGLNVTALREAKERRLAKRNRAVNTVAAYTHCWSTFERWCVYAGKQPLPALPDTVELFVEFALQKPYRLDTIRLYLAAIKNKHLLNKLPSPVSPTARELISIEAREPEQQEQKQKMALTPKQLASICKSAGTDLLAIRDCAILVFGFATGFRRGELAALQLRDITFEAGGNVVVLLRRSKTDQFGEGRKVCIQPGNRVLTCPVRRLKSWVEARGLWPGPLFCKLRYGRIMHSGIQGRIVANAVKVGLERIGLDSHPYAGHSLRAGFITASAENGASELAIRERTGHKTIGMLARYVRAANGMRTNPLRGVL